MMNATATQINRYMQDRIENHRDVITDGVNATTLAKDACDHFGDYDAATNVPALYFELAVELVAADEKRRFRMQFFAPKVIRYEADGDCIWA